MKRFEGGDTKHTRKQTKRIRIIHFRLAAEKHTKLEKKEGRPREPKIRAFGNTLWKTDEEVAKYLYC